MPDPKQHICSCGEEMERSTYCGAWVCPECGNHEGLVRCYCGWAADGGDGRRQLEEMGETIDPEPGVFPDDFDHLH